MTGAEFCRRLLRQAGVPACVVTGAANQYVAGERLIVLRPHCYGGTSSKNLTLAAHEAGHAEQHEHIGWAAPALRWILLGRLLLEWDASNRGRRLMIGDGREACEDVLAESWKGYLVPGIWQIALMFVLVVAAAIWRR